MRCKIFGTGWFSILPSHSFSASIHIPTCSITWNSCPRQEVEPTICFFCLGTPGCWLSASCTCPLICTWEMSTIQISATEPFPFVGSAMAPSLPGFLLLGCGAGGSLLVVQGVSPNFSLHRFVEGNDESQIKSFWKLKFKFRWGGSSLKWHCNWASICSKEFPPSKAARQCEI